MLKAAGLLTERRQANKVIYSLVPDRLALCVGSFLSAVCPEEMLARHQGKKKPKAPEKVSAKSPDKPSGKAKRRRALVKPVSSPANLATDQVSATV